MHGAEKGFLDGSLCSMKWWLELAQKELTDMYGDVRNPTRTPTEICRVGCTDRD